MGRKLTTRVREIAQRINRSHWMLIFKLEWWWKKNKGKYIYYWHAIDVDEHVRDK